MNIRTRVKICGITRPEDAVAAARLGVDAIGLVFYEKSPRNLSLQQAQVICEALPGFISVVSLFMDPPKEQVEGVLEACPVDLIQFHGKETADFCESFARPYIKAVAMADESDFSRSATEYASAKALLLDSHAAGAAGGTGKTFDWDRIPENYKQSIVLAGGLKPGNVAEAIRKVHPYALDLSSGVESQAGIKDPGLMAQLMNEVKRVDCEQLL